MLNLERYYNMWPWNKFYPHRLNMKLLWKPTRPCFAFKSIFHESWVKQIFHMPLKSPIQINWEAIQPYFRPLQMTAFIGWHKLAPTPIPMDWCKYCCTICLWTCSINVTFSYLLFCSNLRTSYKCHSYETVFEQ